MKSGRKLGKNILTALLGCALLVTAVTGFAQDHATELAKKLQNPVGDLISVPLQNNFNFGYGPENNLQYVLNIQPVIPQHLNKQWNWIHRTILPVINQPSPVNTFGLGDIQYQGFLSPAQPGKTIWGVGPVLQVPSATDEQLGTGKWSAGAGGVVLHMDGHWVNGALLNNIWSFAGDGSRTYVNQMLCQPFVNYNLGRGLAVGSAPIITANWAAPSGQQWTVPLGAQVSQIIPIAKVPVNFLLGGYYNIVKPDNGPEWALRFQIALLFPD